MAIGPSMRDEAPPGDEVVVVRGGLHSLAREKVREVSEDGLADSGFYGLSVFAALDGDVRGLCGRVPRLRSPGTIWVAACGQLRHGGFALLPTDAQPHFDILLPDLEPGTIEALVTCFSRMENPAKQR